MNPFYSWITEGWAVLLELSFLIFGGFFATARKTLAIFSRKTLLTNLEDPKRTRFTEYLDHQDEYNDSLRLFDNGLRLILVAFVVGAVDSEKFSALSWLGRSGSIAIVALTLILTILIFLELLPSVVARRSPERLLGFFLPTLYRFYLCVKGPMEIYQKIVDAGARALGSPPEREAAEMMEEEILTAAEEGGREGILQKTEIFMIEAILNLSDRKVEEVLTPRTEMVAVDIESDFQDVLRLARECGHSRIPVYQKNKDNILGILYVKDLLKFLDQDNSSPPQLEEVLRKPHYVRESKLVSELFQEFKTQRFHIALVIDEFGGTEGLITIEDIIEEILGEIEEESPTESEDLEPLKDTRFVRIDDRTFEVEARLAIHEVNRELGKAIGGEFPPEVPLVEGVETIGGFLSSALGRIPSKGEIHQEGAIKFEVIEADERSIGRLRLQLLPAEASQ